MSAEQCCRQRPCIRPGKGPCDMPAASMRAENRGEALPAWFDAFLRNVAELPDRNSPEDEPEAMIATAEDLRNCAQNAIEEHSGYKEENRGEEQDGRAEGRIHE